MNIKYQNLLYIFLGFLLATSFGLISDWYNVKIHKIELNDLYFWSIWVLLSAPCIFYGLNKIINKKIYLFLISIIILFIFAIINIFIFLNFHFWIGGEK